MSKNGRNTARRMSTKTMTYCALLAALQVAMARFFGLMPSEFTRFSVEAVPTVIAGILFGPAAGGLVGFVADLVGCLFSGYGYNPIFCIPPILYGVCAGLFRPLLARKLNIGTLFLTLLPAVFLGSILWQSWALGFVSGKGFWFYFTTRSIQFAITIAVDVAIIFGLFKSRLFSSLHLWPPKKQQELSVAGLVCRMLLSCLGLAMFGVYGIIGLPFLDIPITVSFASMEAFLLDLSQVMGYFVFAALGVIMLYFALKERNNDSRTSN